MDHASPTHPPVQGPPRRSQVALLAVVVGVVGLSGVALAAATGRLDSALLFVGVPCLLAFGIGTVRGRGGWGTVFQVVTVVLLLCSALLQEAAVCVLVAAPLVYGIAAVTYAAVTATRRRGTRALALSPILLVVLVEGVLPGARIHPEQTASATRTVGSSCADFEAALARGPRPDPDRDRGLLLRALPYPTPTAATGSGLAPGDGWTLTLGGGELRTRVTDATPASLGFEVASDTTRLERWVTVRSGRLAWTQTPGGCRATMTVGFERHLDPALYFGPVSELFVDAGADAFLAALD